MAVYILTFLLMLTVMAALAVGVVFGNRRLRGSCGGISCGGCANRNACPRSRRQENPD